MYVLMMRIIIPFSNAIIKKVYSHIYIMRIIMCIKEIRQF